MGNPLINELLIGTGFAICGASAALAISAVLMQRFAEIAKAADEVKGKSEMDALIAYLQVMGTAGANAAAAK